MSRQIDDGLLLLMMTLGIAGCPGADTDSGEADESGAGPTTSPSSDSSGPEPTSSEPGDSTTGTGVTTTTTDVDDSTSSETSGSGDSSGESGGVMCSISPIPPVCYSAAERWDLCLYGGDGMVTQGYAEGCACRLDYAATQYGAECVAALEDYYACLSQADCMEIVLQEHCNAEFGPIFDVCPGLSPQ